MKKLISALTAAAVTAAMSAAAITASAEVKYTLPVNDISYWYSSGTAGWGTELAESDYMTGEASSEGMRIWPTGNHPYGYPNARVEDTTGTTGIVTFTEDDYVNFNITYEGTSTQEADGFQDGWQMKLNFGSAAIAGVQNAIAGAVGVEVSNNRLPAGNYQASIAITDLLTNATQDNGDLYDNDQLYNAILGADGQPNLISLQFIIYGEETSDVLTIRSWTVSDSPEYSENTYTELGAQTDNSSSSAGQSSAASSSMAARPVAESMS